MFLVYYFACCIVVLVASIIGGISGSLTSMFGNSTKQTSILVGVGTFFLVIVGVWGYWIYGTTDYYGYGGDFDYYRIPLDYPYEISMIDTTDCGDITKWQEDRIILGGITQYHKQDNIIIGKISSECFFSHKSEWFSFDTSTGKAVLYASEKEYEQAIKELGFSKVPELLMLDDNARLYWKSYREDQVW